MIFKVTVEITVDAESENDALDHVNTTLSMHGEFDTNIVDAVEVDEEEPAI